MTPSHHSCWLFTPFQLGSITMQNRIVMAPMTRARAGKERVPNELMAEYYCQRASAGLIITEATSISEAAIGWVNNPGIYNQTQTDGWRRVVHAVHRHHAPLFMQLWHCGRASHSSFQPDHQPPFSASAIKLQGDMIHTPLGKAPYETPRAMTAADIQQTLKDYRRASENAKSAGFDGIEIHGANGYLIDQFLQTNTNHRSDAYGGSVENRARFLMDVLDTVCQVWPADRVGVRISPNGMFNDMGHPEFRQTFLYVAEQLNSLGLAYLHVMDGLGFGFHGYGEPMTMAEFRPVFDGPLMCNVGYTQATAESALASGQTDLVAFGRPFIANPDLVQRFAHGWPLAEEAPVKVWYSFDETGYTDYPAYQSPLATAH